MLTPQRIVKVGGKSTRHCEPIFSAEQERIGFCCFCVDSAGQVIGSDGITGETLVLGNRAPLIAVTDSGITTPCARYAAQELEESGYETVVFHTVGSGGTAMEELIARGLFVGVLDLTTHEFIDHLVGGYYGDIGPERLETAGKKGIAQVVGPGGLDCIAVVHHGEVPACFLGRKVYYHDFRRGVRSNAEELVVAAQVMAERLNRAIGPVKVLLPLKGWSEADKEGGSLYDPQANRAFAEEMKKRLKPQIAVVEVDAHLNDPLYAETAVALLEKMMGRK